MFDLRIAEIIGTIPEEDKTRNRRNMELFDMQPPKSRASKSKHRIIHEDDYDSQTEGEQGGDSSQEDDDDEPPTPLPARKRRKRNCKSAVCSETLISHCATAPVMDDDEPQDEAFIQDNSKQANNTSRRHEGTPDSQY